MENYIIFHIEGGCGKNVMATAVAKAIKTQYPEYKIIIVTAWPQVWYNNTSIYRFYGFNQNPYMHEDFIKGRDTKIFKCEPYHHEDHLNHKSHLIETWCKMLDIKYNGEQPEIFLTAVELKVVNDQIPNDKPLIAIQSHGGLNTPDNYSWSRDLPIHIVNKVYQQIAPGFNWTHLRKNNQPSITNIPAVGTDDLRRLFAVINRADKLLLIDSYAQHVAAALNKKAVVCWPIDNVGLFGYQLHHNIVCKKEKKVVHKLEAYLFEDDLRGIPNHFPYDNLDLFEPQEIIDALQEK